ncbi:hypothetical protein FGG08_004317 [Glutinoglossum americanum]|uniref:Aminoglycoside phosphotransferase domain-containing protein n=1 Tax=Glutinoglossum americanum TaxID=1670608 RepID=A0A9P8KX83_9PEZI|nr:hypothetical protein FGG08_004317 [Glutinoglossum americanum]
MKYISERTTIPVPRLFGYGFKDDNPTGLPFMIMEYIDGVSLFTVDFDGLDDKQRTHLHGQLADIFIQLHLQQFDRIGSLTLDRDDSSWTFGESRPLTIDINDQEIDGLDVARIIGPDQTYGSTIDYIYTLMQLVFNQFLRGRHSVYSEKDARWELYGLHKFRALLMEYVLPEYNHGPFVLMHGDFRSSNIMMDENLNIVSVIDWEWSRTVPAQLFVPPEWLTGYEVNGLLSVYNKLHYMRELFNFRSAVWDRERSLKQENALPAVPLSKLWRTVDDDATFFIAHALLRFHVLGDIYWDCLDRRYYGTDPEGRINDFYDAQATECQLEIVKKKLDDLAIYKKELEDSGIEKDQPREPSKTAQARHDSLKTIKREGNEVKGLVALLSNSGAFSALLPLSWR